MKKITRFCLFVCLASVSVFMPRKAFSDTIVSVLDKGLFLQLSDSTRGTGTNLINIYKGDIKLKKSGNIIYLYDKSGSDKYGVTTERTVYKLYYGQLTAPVAASATALNTTLLTYFTAGSMGLWQKSGGRLYGTNTDSVSVGFINGGITDNGDLVINGTRSTTKASSYINLQTTGGNVGIGTSAPTLAKLEVNTTISNQGVRSNIMTTTGSNYAIIGLANGSGATDNYGLYANATSATNNYSIYIAGPSLSSNSFAFYSAAPSKSYFEAKLGMGVTSPLSTLHLKAGTATANSAPLQFSSGTVETTARSGVMEYNGTNLFFTESGTTRKTVLCSTAPSTTTLTALDKSIPIVIDGTTYYIPAKLTNN